MYPVQGGTQKVTFNKPDPREYDAMMRSSMNAYGQGNPAMAGIQEVVNKGFGAPIAASRNKYGAPRIMPNELMQGANSNFAQADVPGNSPLEDTMNQSGNLQDGISTTTQPQRDVEDMEGDALERRLAMYRNAAGNAGASLNRQEYA